MTDTIQEVCALAADWLGYERETDYVNSYSDDARRLVAAVQLFGRRLARTQNLASLKGSFTHVGRAGETQIALSGRLLAGSVWLQDTDDSGYPIEGPASETRFRAALLREQGVVKPLPSTCRLYQGDIMELSSPLKVDQRVHWREQSHDWLWLAAADRTAERTITAGTNMVRFPSEVLVHGVVWWLLEAQGHVQESVLARQRYDATVMDLSADYPESY